jgi:hypothetical protein
MNLEVGHVLNRGWLGELLVSSLCGKPMQFSNSFA